MSGTSVPGYAELSSEDKKKALDQSRTKIDPSKHPRTTTEAKRDHKRVVDRQQRARKRAVEAPGKDNDHKPASKGKQGGNVFKEDKKRGGKKPLPSGGASGLAT